MIVFSDGGRPMRRRPDSTSEAAMNEKQLAKLIKQAAAKADAKAKARPKNFDATLTHKPDHDDAAEERKHLFSEMKKREF